MDNIENWVNNKIKDYSDDSYNLFTEAILCYKIKAYRASFLFSYLGFFKYVKELLNKSKKPSGFSQSRWDSILHNIKLEDKWEEEILTALNNSSNPIFNINDNIRVQIKYLKDRRNDCAHAKNNIINHHHVEIFWTFLQSNLSKITVEGGKLTLLNKFSDQFDTAITSRFESYDYLIDEIENSVESTELESFINDLWNTLRSKAVDYSKIYELYDKILTKYSTVLSIKNAIISNLKLKDNDLDFLTHYPSNFINFQYSNIEIRQIWYSKIYGYNYHSSKDKILGVLLSNVPFSGSDLKELIEIYIDNFDQSGFRNLTKDFHLRALIGNAQFLEQIYLKYFDKDKLKDLDFGAINKQADLIALYIEKCNLTLNLVKTISLTYESTNPNFLSESLKDVMVKNQVVKQNFTAICQANLIANLDFLVRV